ncbi:hypothetical protein [Phaeovulum sp. W22_SRMD_FR3]|uniref:hypothetical protein n=1 Tax=Phaeovulum sp. W22_SRMD_FR3 TaxID=3240274 RepID=UPI003F9B4D98
MKNKDAPYEIAPRHEELGGRTSPLLLEKPVNAGPLTELQGLTGRLVRKLAETLQFAPGGLRQPAEVQKPRHPADVRGLRWTRQGRVEVNRLINPALLKNGVALFCGENNAEMRKLRDWYEEYGGAAIVVEEKSPPLDWLAENYATLDFCFVDSDYVGEVESLVDLGLRLRVLAPRLPIIMGSRRVTANDFSVERIAICDTTLKMPVSQTAFLLGIQSELQNNKYSQDRQSKMP